MAVSQVANHGALPNNGCQDLVLAFYPDYEGFSPGPCMVVRRYHLGLLDPVRPYCFQLSVCLDIFDKRNKISQPWNGHLIIESKNCLTCPKETTCTQVDRGLDALGQQHISKPGKLDGCTVTATSSNPPGSLKLWPPSLLDPIGRPRCHACTSLHRWSLIRASDPTAGLGDWTPSLLGPEEWFEGGWPGN